MENISVTLDEIEQATSRALQNHGALPWIAEEVAKAVRVAEATGNIICGLYYLDSYCKQLKSGRVDGHAEPEVSQPKPASIRVDARQGFAQAAFSKGIDIALKIADNNGISALAICHSHTCTSMGYFTSQIAKAGFIGIGMTNAPACVSPPGGNKALLGTNPIAMSIPSHESGVAFQFDQSTSAVAIGKIRMAAASGDDIPLGWAVDKDGHPTKNPNEALQGSLVSSGGYKGYGFGLMAEILASALTGSVSSIDAAPLKITEGVPHNLGQFYFLIDPTNFCGDIFWDRIDALQQAIKEQPNARLPGTQKTTPDSGVLDRNLWQQVTKLAST